MSNYTVGQTVYYAALNIEDGGAVKVAEVRPLIITKIIPNYLGKRGLYYGAHRDGNADRAMAYSPERLYPTSGAALNVLKQRIKMRISDLQEALNRL